MARQMSRGELPAPEIVAGEPPGMESLQTQTSAAALEPLLTVREQQLEGLHLSHPLLDRSSPVVIARLHTTEAGHRPVQQTGPRPRRDDFTARGRKYNLRWRFCPVDAGGTLTASRAVRRAERAQKTPTGDDHSAALEERRRPAQA